MTELMIWKLYSGIECVLAVYKDLIHVYIPYIYIYQFYRNNFKNKRVQV